MQTAVKGDSRKFPLLPQRANHVKAHQTRKPS